MGADFSARVWGGKCEGREGGREGHGHPVKEGDGPEVGPDTPRPGCPVGTKGEGNREEERKGCRDIGGKCTVVI